MFDLLFTPSFIHHLPPPLPPSSPLVAAMFKSFALASLALASVARAQNVGTNTAEKHPSLGWTSCSKTGGCQSQTGSVTVDANWRWTHTVSQIPSEILCALY